MNNLNEQSIDLIRKDEVANNRAIKFEIHVFVYTFLTIMISSLLHIFIITCIKRELRFLQFTALIKIIIPNDRRILQLYLGLFISNCICAIMQSFLAIPPSIIEEILPGTFFNFH